MAILHYYEDEEDVFNREESYERHLKEGLWETPLGAGGIGIEIAEERAKEATCKEELEWFVANVKKKLVEYDGAYCDKY